MFFKFKRSILRHNIYRIYFKISRNWKSSNSVARENYLKKQSMKTYKHIAPRVIRVTMRNNAENLV